MCSLYLLAHTHSEVLGRPNISIRTDWGFVIASIVVVLVVVVVPVQLVRLAEALRRDSYYRRQVFTPRTGEEFVIVAGHFTFASLHDFVLDFLHVSGSMGTAIWLAIWLSVWGVAGGGGGSTALSISGPSSVRVVPLCIMRHVTCAPFSALSSPFPASPLPPHSPPPTTRRWTTAKSPIASSSCQIANLRQRSIFSWRILTFRGV